MNDGKMMNQLSYTVSNKRFQNIGFGFKGSIEQRVADAIELLKNSTRAKIK